MTKKNVYCVFDTETIGIDNKWIYDLGMVIIEKTGEPLYKKRWIIHETMTIPDIAKIAFYGEKILTFYNKFSMVKFARAREEFREIMEDFGVNVITAYNLQFDMRAIIETLEYTGIGNKFLNYPVEYFDLWNACCNSIFQQKEFQETALKQNWLSKVGNYRSTAEVAYRYITKDFEFSESHTALEDASIEAVILQEVCRQKKALEKNTIVYMPWKKIQEKRIAL